MVQQLIYYFDQADGGDAGATAIRSGQSKGERRKERERGEEPSGVERRSLDA